MAIAWVEHAGRFYDSLNPRNARLRPRAKHVDHSRPMREGADFEAFREADVTVVLPADFTKLVWAGLAGFLVFAEIPDPWTLVGAVIICGAVFYLAVAGDRQR